MGAGLGTLEPRLVARKGCQTEELSASFGLIKSRDVRREHHDATGREAECRIQVLLGLHQLVRDDVCVTVWTLYGGGVQSPLVDKAAVGAPHGTSRGM